MKQRGLIFAGRIALVVSTVRGQISALYWEARAGGDEAWVGEQGSQRLDAGVVPAIEHWPQ